MFYIFATIHSQTVLYTALDTSQSHSLQLLCQTFVFPGGTNCLIMILPSLTKILYLLKCNMRFFALNLVLKYVTLS
jgi:hypothetical protein